MVFVIPASTLPKLFIPLPENCCPVHRKYTRGKQEIIIMGTGPLQQLQDAGTVLIADTADFDSKSTTSHS